MITRRRLLALSAAALVPVPAKASTEWRGRAFGSDVSLSLTGQRQEVDRDLGNLLARMREIEATFTLYDPAGPMAWLNRKGQGALSPDLERILTTCATVHSATDGHFDPTIQSLWVALAENREPDQSLVDFSRVDVGGGAVRLSPGQALSFNGVAQGYAAQELRGMLAARGYRTARVDMGETAALGGPFRLGVEDPGAGRIAEITLANACAATSSPAAMTIGGRSHILHPQGGQPLWSSVTVIGPDATLADAASTAFCLMRAPDMEKAAQSLGLSRVLLVDREGNLATL
ncbi:FAD:protein FMN transferase [Maritimibacter sp. DP1N21-5]|uniref:FAD:protein FMN transferase n=1 Tax=Maritimibacter sp. DP1N21-5 TaxID=2836867 RepID=UPI001C46978A|nr:FAD:protein FMN transferase [Maritimibacter sp. DP1N21-5]MBV7409215.1 FAD:protein FMN transferase [Maritimibacter sp. DP1N21-5]